MTSPSPTAAILRAVAAGGALLFLAGCGGEAPPPATQGRPVQVVTVESSKLRDAVLLTGDVQASKDVDAAFRIAGRVLERRVNIGDRVVAGQVLATLDPSTEENALKAAKAVLGAARGELSTARNAYERQQTLMDQGFTTRPRYEQARQALETAEAGLEDAEARLQAAQDRVGFTQLRADAAGVVTARGAEPGEVVQAGRMVVRIARDGGRDAVFDASAAVLSAGQADMPIRVVLAGDEDVSAVGRVREVSPEADPATRTFRVRVGLDNPPEAMRLGATVNGSFDLRSNLVVAIPASALTSHRRSAAVWVVDPATSRVDLREVDILRFEPGRVVLSQGLEPGDVIVAAGVQALRPGQWVRPVPARAPTATARQAATPTAQASREFRG